MHGRGLVRCEASSNALSRDAREVLLLHARVAQPRRDAERRVEPCARARSRRPRAPSSRAVGSSPIAIATRASRALGRGAVELHHRGQHDRVREAVVQRRQMGVSACASAWQAPSPFWNAIAPSIAATIMSVAGGEVRRLPERDRERARHPADAVDRHRVRERVEAVREVRLEAVGEGVHAGRGGERAAGRPTVSSGSQIAALRQEVRAEDHRLPPGVRQRRHAGAARPPSRCPAVVGMAMSGGMSSLHEPVAARRVVVARERRRVRGEQLHQLGRVERAAAADRDEAVAAARPVRREARGRVPLGRVRLHVLERARTRTPARARARSSTRRGEPRLHDARDR